MTQHLTTLEEISRALPFGRAALPGILTAGQPTLGQITQLVDAGVRTIVDLRAPHEPRGFSEPDAVQTAGLEYHNIPIGHEGVSDREFDVVRALLRDAGKRPVLLHCASANRVGALMIPYLVLDEQRTPEAALHTAQEIGLRSRALADAALAYVRARSATSRP